MLTALIMAGGQGTRMARSGAPRPKPLVEVAGVPVIERNLQQLVRAGADEVVVSVAADAWEVRAFVTDRMVPLGRAVGIDVRELVEAAPLGNIGAAGLLRDCVDDLLVVYADNVTALDLGALVEEHRAGTGRRRDLTIAAHHEPFRMPFGEITVGEDGRLVAYTEKPTHQILIGSAVMVVGAEGLSALRTDEPTGISQLAQRLVDADRDVRVSIHEAPWVDVNDLAAIDAADALVARHHDAFETWLTDPVEPWTLDLTIDKHDEECDGGGGTATADAVRAAQQTWRAGAPTDDPDATDPSDTTSLGTFDSIDLATGRRLRIHTRIPSSGQVGGRSATRVATGAVGTSPASTCGGKASEPPIETVAGRIAARLRHRTAERDRGQERK